MFAGGTEEKVNVTLEKAGSARRCREAEPAPNRRPSRRPSRRPRPEDETKVAVDASRQGDEDRAKTEPRPSRRPTEDRAQGREDGAQDRTKAEPAARGQGTLLLGSKPPCDIFIDGKSTGLQTPQRDIKLPAGKHKVTLVNNEFGIKETFAVDIKADATEKQIKDYSDRIPK